MRQLPACLACCLPACLAWPAAHACPQVHHSPSLLLPQGQQRRIRELEAQVAGLAARLEEAEGGRAAAEEHNRALGGEVESSASVFKLHYGV